MPTLASTDVDALDDEHGIEIGEDRLGRGDDLAHLGASYKDGELVAAQPGNGVGRCELRAESRSDLAQQPVPVVMAEGVVDLLEPVEVHQQDCTAGRAVFGDRRSHITVEKDSVGEAGQGVGRPALQLVALAGQLVGLSAVLDRNTGVVGERLEQGQVARRPVRRRPAAVGHEQRPDDCFVNAQRSHHRAADSACPEVVEDPLGGVVRPSGEAAQGLD